MICGHVCVSVPDPRALLDRLKGIDSTLDAEDLSIILAVYFYGMTVIGLFDTDHVYIPPKEFFRKIIIIQYNYIL